MELLDLFDTSAGGAFNTITLTTAINKRPYQPNFLGSLGIFTRVPTRTTKGSVIITDEGDLKIIPTSPRGAPVYEQTVPVQNLKSFETPRIAAGDTITAAELMGIIARNAWQVGSDTMALILQDLASEIAYRMDGPIGLQAKMETTKERMRLGAISGVVLDADGSVLYDWPSLLGFSLPAEIPFSLSAANPTPGVLANLIRDLKRTILRTARAGNLASVRLIALCGDAFFDTFVNHPDVITAYNTYQVTASQTALARLGSPNPNIDAFDTFPWAGVEWVNYRGTDDEETIAIPDDKCKFIPVIPGLFQEVLAPGETFDQLGQMGLPVYAMILPDRERNAKVRLEVYSYPMYVATRPDILYSGRLES
jgi:hypothetical protein